MKYIILMEKIGIICEYNPFHHGHVYHLQKIKELYKDSLIILIIDGPFLERGEISILTKESKTRLALKYGVDIVISLPTLYACQSADTFAYHAIELLNKLKIDRIIFGSESNDIDTLKKISKLSLEKDHDEEIKTYLDKGLNYPTALAKCLKTGFEFLPNDLLAISYIKAVLKINPDIKVESIKRTNSFHDLDSNEKIISASNIRHKLLNNLEISSYLPKESLKNIVNINYDLYYNILKTIILRSNNLNEILDVDEGIEYRLKKGVTKCNNLNDFISFIKTKRYTYNKINRMLIHILLNITKKEAQMPNDYLSILGFNKKGQSYLNKIKKEISSLNNNKSYIKDIEIKASRIYDILTGNNTTKKELSNKPIIY